MNFLVSLATGMSSVQQSLRNFGGERTVFWRESSSGINHFGNSNNSFNLFPSISQSLSLSLPFHLIDISSLFNMEYIAYFIGKNLASIPQILYSPLLFLALFYSFNGPRGLLSDYYLVLVVNQFACQVSLSNLSINHI